MISVQIHGGLGNQLFQYAFVYTAAKKLNTSYYLDESIDVFKCGKYFNIEEPKLRQWLRKVYCIKGMHRILAKFKLNYFTRLRQKHQLKPIVIDQHFTPEDELEKLKNQALFVGFFQAAQYFETQKAAVLHQFSIRKKYQLMFKKATENISPKQKLVCIHVRRGDYVDLQLTLPLSYYQQAIEKIHHTNNHYVFISDEPAFIREHFDYVGNKSISNHTEIIDLQYLINSDINILSNSSFSWWGAYLNKKNAFTIAPQNWLGKTKQYPVNITPPHWHLI